MKLKIITTPNKILRNKSAKIKKVDDEVRKLALNMKETMTGKGVGLAAPQVGKNARMIIVAKIEDRNELANNQPLECMVIINPKITSKSVKKVWGEEGCLSIPGVWGQVLRHEKITVRYLDETGKEQKLKCRDFLARIVQHEADHLDGILFTDKATGIKKAKEHKNDIIQK